MQTCTNSFCTALFSNSPILETQSLPAYKRHFWLFLADSATNYHPRSAVVLLTRRLPTVLINGSPFANYSREREEVHSVVLFHSSGWTVTRFAVVCVLKAFYKVSTNLLQTCYKFVSYGSNVTKPARNQKLLTFSSTLYVFNNFRLYRSLFF